MLEINDLVIDAGLSRDEMTDIVTIGDVISLAQPFEELNDQVVIGRNFDDRVGVYADARSDETQSATAR